jgi:hypothetical protein
MTESNQVISELLDLCKAKGVMRIKTGTFEAEFFADKPTPMDMSPKAIASAMSDSMPPDSAMLFASSEDMPETETPTSQTREQDAVS